MINGKLAKSGQEICDLDRVDTIYISTLADACAFLEISTEGKVFSRKGVQRGLEDLLQPEDEIFSISLTGCAVTEAKQQLFVSEASLVSAPGQISVLDAPPSFVPERNAFSEITIPGKQVEAFAEALEQQSIASTVAEEQSQADPARSEQKQLMIPSSDTLSEPEQDMTAPTVQTAAEATSQMHAQSNPQPEQEMRRSTLGRMGIQVTLNGTPVTLPIKEDRMPYQFIDMLNLVELDPTRPQGNIVLLLNGNIASYLDEVHNGDHVEIRWENE